jgi:pimeloyl-ACP methyl ester carboxylesterase
MLDDGASTSAPSPHSDEASLPPVVLVHGLASSFDHGWRQNAWTDLLADADRQVVPVDLPGHGTAAGADPGAYADVEGQLAATIAPHAPVDAVGFSAGARVLLGMAAEDPAQFRKLVVIGLGDSLFSGAGGREPLAQALEAGPEAAAEQVGVQLFLRLARTAGNDPAEMATFLRRPEPPLGEAELRRITCPVLVVIGDRDFSGPADRLAATLPDAELVVLRNTDHFAAPRDFACIERALTFIDADLL